MPTPISSIKDIKPGDFYEDCGYHPLICTLAGEPGDEDSITGISLVDGQLRCCSARHCGVRILTSNEAIEWRLHGPKGAKSRFTKAQRWWEPKS